MKHPLHPALAHLPVGLWFGALVFDIASLLTGNGLVGNALVVSSYYAVLLGVICAGPAAIAGLAELVDIPKGTRARTFALAHMSLNVALVVGYIVQLIVRNTARANVGVGMFIFNLIEFGFLAYSGYLGGRMVYELRVGLRPAEAPEQRPRELRRAA